MRNKALDYVFEHYGEDVDYITFLDADDTLWKNTFANVINFFEQHYSEIDLVAFPMYFFGRKTGNLLLKV